MRYSFGTSALLLVLVIAGCSHSSGTEPTSGILAANDFDDIDGWVADSSVLVTLSKARAHSGAYSTMAAPGHEFSFGYNNKLSRVAPTMPTKIKVSAWVMLPNAQTNAKLVTEIKSSNGANMQWDGLELAKTVKRFNKWQYVEQTVSIPPAAKPDDRLLAYLWLANSKEPVYLDDLKISLATK